ncbi:MAG: type I DNA topoisomerase [Verrucomicrobia bacterium]|nr:type I DNA topoisomerase [Verrucomicrobiota bacterium]
MSKSLVIVESPAKARTINKFLGADYEVLSSVGHVKDLPKKELGVDIANGFEPTYVVLEGKGAFFKDLKAKAKKVDAVYLAPDPDREGEAIAWHIAEEIAGTVPVRRVTFNEITKAAVRQGIENPRDIDQNLVNAQQTRRILDRLVGYQISPLLWKKIKPGLSAGRVQSVALRLICERERQIQAFVAVEYWSITAHLSAAQPPKFTATLRKLDGQEAKLGQEPEAQAIVDELKQATYTVAAVDSKEKKRHPVPPFITSTLQQEASRHFGFGTGRTMRIAQRLYEGVAVGDLGEMGLITYMRTDSTRVAAEAIEAARRLIPKEYGAEYLPVEPNVYRSNKNAQDAHEAVRPTMVELTPAQAAPFLDEDQRKLYTLIWRRFVASQMLPAVFDTTSADIAAGRAEFRATGSVMKFAGWLRAYIEISDEELELETATKLEKGPQDVLLPPLEVGQKLKLTKLVPEQHFTKPPARYTEATLVRELERLGIGRPSTYAAIMSKIESRTYTERQKRHLVPTELGFAVTDMLVHSFPEIMDVGFTAEMEGRLDHVEEGHDDWVETLRRFYEPFSAALELAPSNMKMTVDEKCPACGAQMVKRWGRRGFFLACSNYPECKETKSLNGDEPERKPPEETDIVCDKCGSPMVVRVGRYGEFLACTGYPKCRNIKPFTRREDGTVQVVEPVETGETCEKCGKPLVVKVGRYGKFYACTGYPKCRFTKPIATDVACPKEGCGGKLVRRRAKGRFFYGCSNYPECDFTTQSLDRLDEGPAAPATEPEPEPKSRQGGTRRPLKKKATAKPKKKTARAIRAASADESTA